MSDKEVMPLITKEQLNEMAISEHINSFSGLTVAEFAIRKQRDADLKVLQAEIAWLDNAWRDYSEAQEAQTSISFNPDYLGFKEGVEAAERIWKAKLAEARKEWREKEAEEWETLLRHLILLPETPQMKNIIRAVNEHIAEFRGKSEEREPAQR